MIALTFDDGLNPPHTNQLLDILKKHSVKATFFVIGERAQKYPDMIKHMYTAGHEIGNHDGCIRLDHNKTGPQYVQRSHIFRFTYVNRFYPSYTVLGKKNYGLAQPIWEGRGYP